ncbi:hypothetical protein [Amycolatopsis taiwanensis]|uniref:Uncharacterized protein n=1 Tax=Amycolatopsis taiwanensis TaxID=342230 RepID=A0A9W6R1K8_9PSEU|nr:hypothetical protein [Amycolatopsis taiwanensis]GLY67484.1 hypothetical protein Atai01_41030 [Amycolatopsis taiwanensis]
MRNRLASRVLAAAALAMVFTIGFFPGTASAGTVLAEACTGMVIGNIGDQVAVQGKDLADVVRAGAAEQEIFLHLNGVDPAKLAQEISNQGVLTVAEIPDSAVSALGGDQVATAVTQALRSADGLGLVADQKQKTLDSIGHHVAESCGLTLYAGNYSPPAASPTSQNAGAPPPGLPVPQAPASSGAAVPPRDYGNTPVAVPGLAAPPEAKYPAGAPMPNVLSPEVSTLPGETQSQADVRNTGNASVLAGNDAPTGAVQLPMLLAVVALAGVSAALVRTWVLRKVS